MARSFKRNPFYGRCRTSDAVVKRESHRTIRAHVRAKLAQELDYDSMVLAQERQFVSVETDFGGKDGKSYLPHTLDSLKAYVIRPRTRANRLILVANCDAVSYDFANLHLIRK